MRGITGRAQNSALAQILRLVPMLSGSSAGGMARGVGKSNTEVEKALALTLHRSIPGLNGRNG